MIKKDKNYIRPMSIIQNNKGMVKNNTILNEKNIQILGFLYKYNV